METRKSTAQLKESPTTCSIYLRRRTLSIRCRSGQAFSIIELLAVVAIIALLIGILLPSITAARRRARTTACQTNLRQLAIAWTSYLNQSSDHFLQGVNRHINYGGIQGTSGPTYGPNVRKPLNLQLGYAEIMQGEMSVFLCPSDKGNPNNQPKCYDLYGTSYRTNIMLVGQDQLPINPTDPCKSVLQLVNKRLRGLTRARVSSSHAKVPLLGDFGWVSTWNRYDTNNFDWHDRFRMHNIAFLDGHVDFIRIKKGIHITNVYSIIPFDDLAAQVGDCQQEVP